MAMNPKLADGAEVVAGPAADDAAASGNPVPVGGIYNSTKPTYTALDRTQLQSGSRGALMVEIWGPNANATPLVTVGQDSISSGGNTWFFTSSQGMLFSGSVNSNRAREVVNAADSTGTGIAAAGILAQCNEVSPPTITENQFGNLRMTPDGILLGHEQGKSFLNLASQATTTIKSGAGTFHKLIINTPAATGVITIYDNTAGSGTLIATITQPGALLSSGPVAIEFDVKFATGLTVVTATATQDLTFVYR